MKKEVILVPKGKCPLDVLSQMGERIRNSWIFIHTNVYKHLCDNHGVPYLATLMNANQKACFSWGDLEKESHVALFCEVPQIQWGKLLSVHGQNVSCDLEPDDPEEIYFLKMDE